MPPKNVVSGKVAKKGAPPSGGAKKRSATGDKKRRKSRTIYYKVLKQVHPDTGRVGEGESPVSDAAGPGYHSLRIKSIMNSFVNDISETFASFVNDISKTFASFVKDIFEKFASFVKDIFETFAAEASGLLIFLICLILSIAILGYILFLWLRRKRTGEAN